jgi:hypothetical protein
MMNKTFCVLGLDPNSLFKTSRSGNSDNRQTKKEFINQLIFAASWLRAYRLLQCMWQQGSHVVQDWRLYIQEQHQQQDQKRSLKTCRVKQRPILVLRLQPQMWNIDKCTIVRLSQQKELRAVGPSL